MKAIRVSHSNTPREPKVNMCASEMEDRIIELEAALEKYGQHRPGCGKKGAGCTCGYIDAL